jgi:hypothetical protein
VCGISGLVNFGNKETLSRMTHVQAHGREVQIVASKGQDEGLVEAQAG